MSEPFGLPAEGREVPLELEAAGIEPLLQGPPLVLGLIPLLARPAARPRGSAPPPPPPPPPGLELLLAGHARPQGGVEAIPVGAERFQFVSPLGEPQPIPLGADILQLLRGGFDPPEIDSPDLGPGGLKFGPQYPLEVSGVGHPAPQLLDLGTQPIVLRSESLQLIPQSLRLLVLALGSVELLLKVVQAALGLGELVPRRGELPESGVTPGRLGSQRGADPLELTLRHRPARLVRLGRSRRA